MFVTKEVLAKVGGYNKNYGLYGYEHGSYSTRIFRAGLTAGYGPYVSLPESNDFIYSLDFDKNINKWDNEGLLKPEMMRSAIHGEDVNSYIAQNGPVYNADVNGPIYQEYK